MLQKFFGKGPGGVGGYGQSVERGAIPIIFAATSEEMSGMTKRWHILQWPTTRHAFHTQGRVPVAVGSYAVLSRAY